MGGEAVVNSMDELPRLRDTVVCVATGPSLSLAQIRSIAIGQQSGACSVIAISDSVYPCWFADVGYSCDAKWWKAHGGLAAFAGRKIGLEAVPFTSVTVLTNSGVEGFDERRGHIRSGGNSGYQAVHLAAGLGAKKIILAGYDFSANGALHHWFGAHPAGLNRHSNVQEWLRRFRALTTILRGRGVEVLQASSPSNINWLPPVDLVAEYL